MKIFTLSHLRLRLRDKKLRKILILVVLLFPFYLPIAPERHIAVVDTSGRPVEGLLIRQGWGQYSLDVHADIRYSTDQTGRVLFQRASVFTNILWILKGAISNIAGVGISASFGTHENIMIFRADRALLWECWNSECGNKFGHFFSNGRVQVVVDMEKPIDRGFSQ